MRRPQPLDLFRRLIAAGLAGLVLALSFASVSPSAHNLLHRPDGVHADDHCAVVLFASGVSAPLAQVDIAAPALAWQQPAMPLAPEGFTSSPRYLRLPSRGPPDWV
jgi:hypothetical protein